MKQLLVRFEAYSLEELCSDFSIEQGSWYLEYLTNEIWRDSLGGSADAMEYALIYLQSLIDAIEKQLEDEDDIPDENLPCLFNHLKKFMEDKDEQTLVYIQGW